MNYDIEREQRDRKYVCDLMPQQRGFIDPKLYTIQSVDGLLEQQYGRKKARGR